MSGFGRAAGRGRTAAAAALLLMAPALAASQSGRPDRGLEIMNQAAERYARVETLCADFTQQLLVPLLNEERTGVGRLCQAQPNRFAMRFSDPAGDRIVADGESVWVYYPSLDAKQVMRVPAEQGGGHDFFREFLEDPATKYDITYEGEDTVDGVKTHRIRLVPRAPASYRAAVVWIEQGEPVLRRIRVEEENQSVRTITLTNVEIGATPEPGWFTFKPPEGALVISPDGRVGMSSGPARVPPEMRGAGAAVADVQAAAEVRPAHVPSAKPAA